MPDYHRDPRVNVRAPEPVQAAAQQGLEQAGWTLQSYVLACLILAGQTPAEAIAAVAHLWTPPPGPGRPRKAAGQVRTANAVLWRGNNLAEVQRIRPEARLADDGTSLLIDSDDGAMQVVGLNHVVRSRG